jgi:hypothetical protein
MLQGKGKTHHGEIQHKGKSVNAQTITMHNHNATNKRGHDLLQYVTHVPIKCIGSAVDHL